VVFEVTPPIVSSTGIEGRDEIGGTLDAVSMTVLLKWNGLF